MLGFCFDFGIDFLIEKSIFGPDRIFQTDFISVSRQRFWHNGLNISKMFPRMFAGLSKVLRNRPKCFIFFSKHLFFYVYVQNFAKIMFDHFFI